MAAGIPIEISGLTKQFGAVTAVDDLSFTVEPGRVTGFLGPNGAGKTTTLRVLLGLVRATAGTATFDGKTLPRPRTAARDRRGGARGRLPSGPNRPQPPQGRGHCRRAAGGPRRTGARPGRHDRARRPPRRRLLARHAPATRARLHPARRPGRVRARRADQRTRSRGHQVDPRVPAEPRPRGTHRARLVAPAERGGADRRRGRHHLEGAAHEERHPRRASNSTRRRARSPTPPTARRSPPHWIPRGSRTPRAAPASSSTMPDPARVGHAAFVGGVELSALHRLESGLEESFLSLVNGGEHE